MFYFTKPHGALQIMPPTDPISLLRLCFTFEKWLMGSGGGLLFNVFTVKPYRGGMPGFLCCLLDYSFCFFAGAKAA